MCITIKSAGTTYYRYYSINENDEEKFIGIYNFSEFDKVAWINEDDGMYTDLISGRELEAKGVQIPAFGCYWLCRRKK